MAYVWWYQCYLCYLPFGCCWTELIILPHTKPVPCHTHREMEVPSEPGPRLACSPFISVLFTLFWILSSFESLVKALDPLFTEVPMYMILGKGDCNRNGNTALLKTSQEFSNLRFIVAAMRISTWSFSQHRTLYSLSYRNRFGRSRACRERGGDKKG